MKKNDILLILVPTFLFVVAWIGFSIYDNIVTSTISGSLNMQIIPINPNFDTATINNLKKRNNVTPLYQLGIPVENQAVQTTPTPTASPTATLIVTPTPISSSEGSLLP